MYAAKEAGRGRYEVFRHEMARELGELLGLEHELRQGFERGEYELHYQPLVHLGSKSIVGAEALLRWRSPSRGLVTADRFISVAETTGLIMQLGEFVVREACEQTSAWEQQGLLPERFVTWVNVSGRQVSAGGLQTLVEAELARAGLAPGRLGIEVTETAVVLEGPAGVRARNEVANLHEVGVQVAIDDFGTGFSSLGHLRRFPVDVIKVDRSFVQGAEIDARDAAITANLASLAHALGVIAIAEGIESESQLAAVQELGCDHAQGFLFAYPMPAGDLGRLLSGDRETFAASA
jgi:EAL domain-containing protein (putative c-di-GMP-specific phosphodiesterase class I)